MSQSLTHTTSEPRRRALLIINPISGVSGKDGLADHVTTTLSPCGWDITVAYTTCHGDATRLGKRAVAEGYDAVIAAGGDGTVNETAAALCHSGVALGILPCGSGNGLARHLGIPVDVDDALRIIANGKSIDSDYATVNGLPFFCTFGVGFDAEVSERFARQHRRGKLSYIRSAIAEYIRYRPQIYTIRTSGRVMTERAFLVAVCNASQYGNNAYIAPHASLTDGLLDITVIHAGTPLNTVIAGADIMTGMIDRNATIDVLRAPEITIERAADGPAHIDGEPVHIDNRIEIKCHHAALKVFTPDEDEANRHFYPILTPMADSLRDMLVTMRHLWPASFHHPLHDRFNHLRHHKD
ncbi:MAG: diacylglycerol kinase family lipid kinase [Candidatus Amulumruptor caecigallinarius]|nr:diacylglycerol kinase family lipid kinase [Candidatus Amulumruptor caecigallinarius]MCM1396186.1 diacylglycerol kinase family lipid kinase [Candidatus Amulumruptor caecigallinarius]MCM1453814.1 diacylglycerol kinase family lipid kinase [bacterium]